MKTIEAFAFLNFLNIIAHKTKGLLAYRIAKNIRILRRELTEYNKVRNDLFSLFGEQLDDGSIRIKAGNEEAFIKELEPYNNEIVDVELARISEDICADAELNAEEMLILMEHMGEL